MFFFPVCRVAIADLTPPLDPHPVRGPASHQDVKSHLHQCPRRRHPPDHMMTTTPMIKHTLSPPPPPPILHLKLTLMTSTKVPLCAKWAVRKCQTIVVVAVVAISTLAKETPSAVRVAGNSKALGRYIIQVQTGTTARIHTSTTVHFWALHILERRPDTLTNILLVPLLPLLPMGTPSMLPRSMPTTMIPIHQKNLQEGTLPPLPYGMKAVPTTPQAL